MDVAGAEKHEEISTQVEGFDAVLIQFERLVVDGAYEILFRARKFVEHCPGVGVFLGLREHEGGEFFARKWARTIKKRTVKVFVEGDLPGIKRRKGEIVAIVE